MFMFVQLIRDSRVSGPHPFTVSSSPADHYMAVTIWSAGDFTSAVGHTRVSDQAYIDGPYGVLSYLNHDAPDLVFIAGGIGITPFLSMLGCMRDEVAERNVSLIWGNMTEQDIIARHELERMAEDLRSLKVVHVMPRQQDWPGETSHTNAQVLERHANIASRPRFFICDPPRMMASLVETLLGLGVSRNRIHHERFTLR